jgi:regulator of sigma E protease
MIVTAAGSVFNLVFGIIVMLLVVSFSSAIGSTTVKNFADGATSVQTEIKDGLLPNDEIIEINGKKVHVFYDLSYKISRYATTPIDMTVIRNGEMVHLKDVVFPVAVDQGVTFAQRDFGVYRLEKTFGTVIKTAFFQSVYTVRMVIDSLYDLVTGRLGIEQMSGPVGITTIITDAAEDAVVNKNGSYLFMLFVILAMNLGCMNLLPFPALDGGRLVFLVIEGITRKPVNAKIENAIHLAGMALLLFFMLIITFKDVFSLIV